MPRLPRDGVFNARRRSRVGQQVCAPLRRSVLATPDRQISLTDPDARSRATSGRGSGVVGYNVQTAVDTKHQLIVTHGVTNVGTDRSQLASVAKEAKATLETESLDVVADRGYFNSAEILACERAGITVTLPKPMTSGASASGSDFTESHAESEALKRIVAGGLHDPGPRG